MRRVIFYFYFLRTSSARGRALPDFFFFFFFPVLQQITRGIGHCVNKVVFFGLATNALNVRNNNNTYGKEKYLKFQFTSLVSYHVKINFYIDYCKLAGRPGSSVGNLATF